MSAELIELSPMICDHGEPVPFCGETFELHGVHGRVIPANFDCVYCQRDYDFQVYLRRLFWIAFGLFLLLIVEVVK